MKDVVRSGIASARWPGPSPQVPRVPPAEVPGPPSEVPPPVREIPRTPDETPEPLPPDVPEPSEP